MWRFTVGSQLFAAAMAFVFGIGFSVFYALFKALRRAVPHSALAVFLEDILFSLICAVVTFLLLLSLLGGEIRFFMIICIALGFFTFYFLLANIVSRGLAFVFKFFGRIFIRFNGALRRFFSDFGKKLKNFKKS